MVYRGMYAMKIISIVNQKGGGGKSVVAFNIGAILTNEYNKKVLFVDFDPQSTLTNFVAPNGVEGPYMFDLMRSDKIRVKETIVRTDDGYSIIPSDIRLSYIKNINSRSLKKLLQGVTGYDYCIIDSPPALSILTINAIAAADCILSVVKPDLVSARGVVLLESIIKTKLPRKAISGVIINQYDQRKISNLTIETLRKSYPVLNSIIKDRAVIAESASMSKDIIEYDGYNEAFRDFYNVVRELQDSGVL